jgi:hypothetical protein
MAREFDPDNPTLGGYDPNAPENLDNIIMKIHSSEWQAILAEQNRRKQQQTEALMAQVRRALVGTATAGENGFNSGYTGALCRWPALFQLEDPAATPNDKSDDVWDDQNEDSPPVSYTKGQPRGLWTNRPNTSGDPVAEDFDSLPPPSLIIANPSATIGTGSGPGIGWHGPYLPPPLGNGADNKLVDGWGRELLFFHDTVNDLLLVLSRGPDGRFDFGDTDTLPEGAPDGTPDYQEPADPIEAVDVTTYTPIDTNGHNADNVVMVLRGSSWRTGWLTLETLTVDNATYGTTKARFVHGVNDSGEVQEDTYTANITGTWTLGPLPQALRFDGIACTGTRQLVVWQDNDGDDAVTSGENHTTINYNLYPHNGHEPRTNLVLDTTTFTPAP